MIREYLAVVTRPQTWPVAITREDALDDVSRLIGNFEIIEDGPVVTAFLVALCREIPAGGPADSRRQHRGNHAGAWGAAATYVQHGRLSALRRPHRAGGRLIQR